MLQIELTPEKAKTLREALDSYLSDLRMEIADTDSMDFREQLKKKKFFLEEILQEMEEEKV